MAGCRHPQGTIQPGSYRNAWVNKRGPTPAKEKMHSHVRFPPTVLAESGCKISSYWLSQDVRFPPIG